MSKYTFLLPVACLNLFLISCNKDAKGPTNINAGSTTNTDVFHEYSSPKTIGMEWDSLNVHGSGIDSIDVNLDGEFDIYFYLKQLNSNNFHLLDGEPPSFYPAFTVTASDKILFTSFTSSYASNQGISKSFEIVQVLEYGEVISHNLNWKSASKSEMIIWEDYFINANIYMIGPGLQNIYGIKYMAFQYKGKLGWIELDLFDKYHPKIIRFALQN